MNLVREAMIARRDYRRNLALDSMCESINDLWSSHHKFFTKLRRMRPKKFLAKFMVVRSY